jgi:hypothetical protein
LSTHLSSEHSDTIDIIQSEYTVDPIVLSSNDFDLTDHQATPIIPNTPFETLVHNGPAVHSQFPITTTRTPPYAFSFNPSSRTSDSTTSYINQNRRRLIDREPAPIRAVNIIASDTCHHNTLHDSVSYTDRGKIGGPLYVAQNPSAATIGYSECTREKLGGTRPYRHLSTSTRVNSVDVAQRLVAGTPCTLT